MTKIKKCYDQLHSTSDENWQDFNTNITFRNISFKSGPGFTQDATASQKNMKSYNRVYISQCKKKMHATAGKHTQIILYLIVTLPGQLHQGWDQSCYRYLGRQSPSPHCLVCSAMMCTWQVKNLHTENDQFSKFTDFSMIKLTKYKMPDTAHCKNDKSKTTSSSSARTKNIIESFNLNFPSLLQNAHFSLTGNKSARFWPNLWHPWITMSTGQH